MAFEGSPWHWKNVHLPQQHQNLEASFRHYPWKTQLLSPCFQYNTLRESCPYSEFFWSAFFCIRTEYSVSLCIQSECSKMRTRKTPNTDTSRSDSCISYTTQVLFWIHGSCLHLYFLFPIQIHESCEPLRPIFSASNDTQYFIKFFSERLPWIIRGKEHFISKNESLFFNYTNIEF